MFKMYVQSFDYERKLSVKKKKKILFRYAIKKKKKKRSDTQ